MMTGHPIKQAFILGAGMGSRMRPLTDALPKPLVPLHGRPLIDHVIDRLKAVGVEKIIVNVHYLADQLEAHLQTHKDIKVIISDERDTLLDTGGGLIKARPYLDDAPFFIHNSDSVWLEEEGAEQSNLSRLSNAFEAEKMESLLLLANSSGDGGVPPLFGKSPFNMALTKPSKNGAVDGILVIVAMKTSPERS